MTTASPHAQSQLASDTGLACLVMLARFHQIAASPEQLTHEYASAGRPFGREELLLAAKSLGLKARITRSTTARLIHCPLPAIAIDAGNEFFIIARSGDGNVLIHDPRTQRPEVLDLAALEARWRGEMILVRSGNALSNELSRFDLTWFVPAIIK